MVEAGENGQARRRLLLQIGLAAGLVIVLAVAAWLLLGFGRFGNGEHFTGYVVSDDVYMTSPVAGTLVHVAVQRGQRVAVGAPLFSVDPTVRAAQTEQARAGIAANRSEVAQRQSALRRARADLAAAQGDADRAGSDLRRLTAAQHDKAGSVAQIEIDRARAAHDSAIARRDAARTELASAAAEIAAADARVREARAGLTSAQSQLGDLAPVAPVAGRIEDVMFKQGESVSPNVPVVSIVPDGEVKVRFYVPQSRVNAYRPGRRVAIACDGCASGMTAQVAFVASEPEYTPPIIYSLDARQKLVFMVEARPSDPARLIPGQPIDVAPTAGDLPE